MLNPFVKLQLCLEKVRETERTRSSFKGTFKEAPLKVRCCVMPSLTSFTLLRPWHLLLEVFEDTLDKNPTQMKCHSSCERQEDLPVVDTITDEVGDEEEGEVDVGGGDADEVDNDPGQQEKRL